MQSGLLHLNNLNSVYRETTHFGDIGAADNDIQDADFDSMEDNLTLRKAEFSESVADNRASKG